AISRLNTQGALEQTGRSLDVAVDGDGFFPVQLPTGNTAYTRDGSFQISDQGVLVTSDGYQIGDGIKIPEEVTDVTISATGGGTEELGRIQLARFANPAGLEAMGQNIFAATPASGEATTGYPQDEGF